MSARGEMTPFIKILAAKLMPGWEISRVELRLLPYIQYLLMNNQRIDPNRTNAAERETLSDWRKAGWMTGGAGSDLMVHEEFWKAMSELLWVAYVAHNDY